MLTSFQDHTVDTVPRPGWMYEEGTNLCGILKRVEQVVLSPCPVVATIECLAFAPAATASDDYLWLCSPGVGSPFSSFVFSRSGFSHEICPACNQLAIHAVNGFECEFDLSWGVVLRLQSADRCVNQHTQNRDIGRHSLADVDVHGPEGLGNMTPL